MYYCSCASEQTQLWPCRAASRQAVISSCSPIRRVSSIPKPVSLARADADGWPVANMVANARYAPDLNASDGSVVLGHPGPNTVCAADMNATEKRGLCHRCRFLSFYKFFTFFQQFTSDIASECI
jgi:hypothetical protein